MPRKKAPVQPDREELLALIPPGVLGVKVRTELGQVKFKEVGNISKEDYILITKAGIPICLKEKPGRPRKPEIAPATPAIAELMILKEKSLASDDILRATRETPESADVLHHVMIGLADEAASISFERKEAERKGDETSHLSIRRVNALKSVADTWLRRKEQIVSQAIDLDSTGFAVLFQYVIETFKASLEDSSVHGEMIKVVLARLSRRVDSDEWRSEVKARMRKNI